MDSIIALLKDTPIPTILVVSGIIFLFLALAGSVAGKLEMPPARQKWSAVASFVLLAAGLLLYIAPVSPEVAAAVPSPTSLPAVASQPAAPPGAQASAGSSEPAAPVVAGSNPAPASLDEAAGCLAEFFSGIPAELLTEVEIGKANKELYSRDETLAGIIVVEFGQPVAGLIFMLFEEDQLFKIAAAVDATCQPAAIENISRGGAEDVLQNWDTLAVTTSKGVYGLRFGYYAGSTSVDTGKIE